MARHSTNNTLVFPVHHKDHLLSTEQHSCVNAPQRLGSSTSISPTGDTVEHADLAKLAMLIERFAPYDGRIALPVANLHVVKHSSSQNGTIHAVSKPSICIAAQGRKSVTLAEQTYQYGAKNMVVYAEEVPVRVRYVDASAEKPYLCLVVHIDPMRLTDLLLKVFPNGVKKSAQARAIYLDDHQPKIIKAAINLLELIATQDNAELLVPLVIDEILIRLLRSQAGAQIAQIGLKDSHASKVSRAIQWLKINYAEAVTINKLATIAGMSTSAFHNHFKNITAMSPLQFQKHLRLQEARTYMITHNKDVSTASHYVGYSSVSQFSREYSRLFGHPPSKDLERFC